MKNSKKFFKKGIATILSVLMVSSSLAFPVMASADETYESIGAINIGPVIYTMGDIYTKYGSNIADATVKGENSTYFNTISGVTVNSITADGSTLSVSNGKLTGTLPSYASPNEKGTSTVQITTNFTYNGKTYNEVDVCTVLTNPIPAHVFGYSQRYTFGTPITKQRNVAFLVAGIGSVASGEGSGSSQSSGNIKTTLGNCFDIYNPCKSSNATTDGNNGKDSHSKVMSSGDKSTSGSFTSGSSTNSTSVVITQSAVANYYYDSSTTDNDNITNNGNGTYSFNIFVGNLYNSWQTDAYPIGIISSTWTSNSAATGYAKIEAGNCSISSVTNNISSTMWNSNTDTKAEYTITGTTSNGTTTGNTFTIYGAHSSKEIAGLLQKFRFNVNVFDKSTVRNAESTNFISSDTYTASSFANYKTAYVNAESYLNNIRNTDDASATQTPLATALTTAYNSLETNSTYNYINNAGTTVSTQTVGSVNDLVAPSNTATTSSTYTSNNDNATHNNNYTTYAWGTPTGTSPTFTITEVATPHSDSQACSFVKSASPVSTTPATIGSPATETYLYTCSLCNQSYEGLAENVGSAVDTSALSTAIANAGNYDEADYTADSYATLTNAVTSGQTVLDTSSSTATDVSNATTAINDAITNLVYQTYTYTYINNVGTTVDTQTVKNVSDLVAPSNTSTKTDYVSKGDDLNHTKTVTTYTWGTPVSNGEFSYTITEVATPVTVDEGCSFVKASEPKSTTGATIGSPATETYTFTCSICNQAYDVTENVGNAVSTTALQTAIDNAEALNSALYTADSFADVTSALDTANSVIANQSSTATQVESATTTLNNAIGALVNQYTYNYYVGSTIVKTQIVTNANQLVAPDNTATGTTYTSDADGKNHTKAVTTYSWGEPVSTGDNTYSITETSATENTTVACTFERTSETPVSQTVATIGAAATETYNTECSVCGQTSTEVVTVGEKVSTTELTNAINSFDNYSQNDYTAGSYQVLAAAVQAGKDVLANNDSVLADVTNATTAITDAINGLVAVADYSALEAIIANVEAVKASNKADYYSTDEYQALVDKLDNALKNAYDTNGNKTLSQLEADTVDNFATELQTAYTNCMNYNKFAVTFNDCGVETTEYYEANTTITLTSEATAGTPTWTVKTGNFDTETIQNDGYSYTFKPSANTVVTLTVEGTETITPVTVNVLTKFNTVYQNLKIDGSKTVKDVLSGITAPLLFGYNFDSWLVNGKSDYNADATIDSLGTSITVKPVYTAQDEWVFDSYNTATSINDDFICWALPIDAAKSVYRVVSYAKNYNYYATGPASCFLEVTQSNIGSITLENNTTLSGGTVKADETTLNAKTPFASLRGIGEDANSNNGQFWDATRKKLSLVCQYTDSSELTVSSCGLELQTASGKRVVTKAKTTTSSKQYLVSYTFSTLQPSQSATLSVRSYVVYTDGDGNSVTSYSPWKNVTISV